MPFYVTYSLIFAYFVNFQEADIAASTFYVTPQRFQVVNYLTPIMYERTTFMVKIQSTGNFHRFLKPLHYTTWGVILAVMILVLCIIYGITNMQQNVNSTGSTESSILCHCERMIRVLFQQGKYWDYPSCHKLYF